MGYFYWDGIPRKADDSTRIAAYVAAQLALQDALAELNDVNIPTPTNGQVLTYNTATGKWIASAAPGGAAGDGHITPLASAYSAIVQGTWSWETQDMYLRQYFINLASGANGDSLEWQFSLAAGTYTLLLFCAKSNNNGILDFDIDAVEVASLDTYAAGLTVNSRILQTGIVIASSGVKTLTARVDGKNGSSGGYYVRIQHITLWRTA